MVKKNPTILFFLKSVNFLAGPTPDWGCPPIQVCRQCDVVDLEDLDGRREEFSEIECAASGEKVAVGQVYTNGIEGATKRDAA